jgi:hypothetical protein
MNADAVIIDNSYMHGLLFHKECITKLLEERVG